MKDFGVIFNKYYYYYYGITCFSTPSLGTRIVGVFILVVYIYIYLLRVNFPSFVLCENKNHYYHYFFNLWVLAIY